MNKLALACTFAFCFWSQVWAAGVVEDLSGQVKIQAGKTAPLPAAKASPFDAGATISTGRDSHATLRFDDGHAVVLQPGTSFRVDGFRYTPDKPEDNNMVLSLLKGGLRSITGLIGQQRKQAFALKTPQATIGIRGTDFMYVIEKAGYSKVSEGSIVMNNAFGSQLMEAGQAGSIAGRHVAPRLIDPSKLPPGIFDKLGSIPVSMPALKPPSPPAASGGESAGLPSLPSVPAVPLVPPVPIAEAALAGAAIGAGVGVGAGLVGALIPGGGSDKESKAPPAATTEPAAGGASADNKAADSAAVAAAAAAASAAEQQAAETARQAAIAQTVAEEKAKAEAAAREHDRSGWALALRAGVLNGPGLEVHKRINDNLALRAAYNGLNYDTDRKIEDVDYKLQAKLQSYGLLADWYIFGGGFRLTAGALQSGNKLDLQAIPEAGKSITLGDVKYTGGSDVARLDGGMDWSSLGPYLGLGWGNPVLRGDRFKVMLDIGVLIQKSPELNYTVTCGPTAIALNYCSTIKAEAEKERQKISDKLDALRYLPVVSLGLAYQF